MTSNTWLSPHHTDFSSPSRHEIFGTISTLGYPQRCFSQQEKKGKNLDNKAISCNDGQSVTSMVFCLWKWWKTPPSQMEISGLIKQDKEPKQSKPSTSTRRDLWKKGSEPFPKCSSFWKMFPFMPKLCLKQTEAEEWAGWRMTLSSSEGPQGAAQEGLNSKII